MALKTSINYSPNFDPKKRTFKQIKFSKAQLNNKTPKIMLELSAPLLFWKHLLSCTHLTICDELEHCDVIWW